MEEVDQVAAALQLAKVQTSPHGPILCAWNAGGQKKTGGLCDYLLRSGFWRVVKALRRVKPDLKVELTTYEAAVAKVLKGESGTKICAEARKILETVAGWRRVVRLKYRVPKELAKKMKRDNTSAAQPRMTRRRRRQRLAKPKAVLAWSDDSDDSLLSAPPSQPPGADAAAGSGGGPPPLTDGKPDDEVTSVSDAEGKAKMDDRDEAPVGYVLDKGWASRTEDGRPARSSLPASNDMAVFVWEDGDRWLSPIKHADVKDPHVRKKKNTEDGDNGGDKSSDKKASGDKCGDTSGDKKTSGDKGGVKSSDKKASGDIDGDKSSDKKASGDTDGDAKVSGDKGDNQSSDKKASGAEGDNQSSDKASGDKGGDKKASGDKDGDKKAGGKKKAGGDKKDDGAEKPKSKGKGKGKGRGRAKSKAQATPADGDVGEPAEAVSAPSSGVWNTKPTSDEELDETAAAWEKMKVEIAEAKKLCKSKWYYRVGVSPRPKICGWEVWIKSNKGQVWTKLSSQAVQVAATLAGTVLFANQKMEHMCKVEFDTLQGRAASSRVDTDAVLEAVHSSGDEGGGHDKEKNEPTDREMQPSGDVNMETTEPTDRQMQPSGDDGREKTEPTDRQMQPSGDDGMEKTGPTDREIVPSGDDMEKNAQLEEPPIDVDIEVGEQKDDDGQDKMEPIDVADSLGLGGQDTAVENCTQVEEDGPQAEENADQGTQIETGVDEGTQGGTAKRRRIGTTPE